VGGGDAKPPSAARGRRPLGVVIGWLEMVRFINVFRDVIQGIMEKTAKVFDMAICIGILVAITLCPFMVRDFVWGLWE